MSTKLLEREARATDVRHPETNILGGFRLAWARLKGRRLLGLGGVFLLLTVAFGPTLLGLARLAWTNELYSHMFLIPLVSLYFVGVRGRYR